MMLTRGYSLRLQMPKCNPFATKSSAIALLKDDLTEVMPYINAEIPESAYHPGAPAVSFSHGDHHISVWPRKILVSNLTGEAEANEVLSEITDLVNDLWSRRDSLEPDHRGREELAAMDAFRLLPGGNCKECGEVACLPFAVKLVVREVTVDACPPLFTDEFADKRADLIEALTSRGYHVPADCV